MIPRRLRLAFEGVPILWARNKEFSVDLNAGSPIASQTEPYLNTVMSRARQYLPKDNDRLHRAVAVFVKQETNHFSLHNSFNAELYKRGYAVVRDLEMKLRADFRIMLEKRSLKFNAAYCAGFENLALFLCKFVFLRGQRHFDGGEKRMVDLFLWHYAEEFEHRTVAHDVFVAVSGSYFLRVYGAIYAFIHLARYKAHIKKVMMDVYRADMTAEEVEASRERESALNWELGMYVLPRMLTVFLPYYNPGRTKVPPIVQATLDRYAAGTT